VYTRTGRRFFEDRGVEAALLDQVRSACSAAGYWGEFASDWFCFDCELMPWSAKAQDLLKNQYAAVGSAARAGLKRAIDALAATSARMPDQPDAPVPALLGHYLSRAERADKYVAAYRQYCWPVKHVSDLKVAPFHLLASEGKVHTDKDHLWHMRTLSRLTAHHDIAPSLFATRYESVDVTDPESEAAAIGWWTELTDRGGEGMVVKPLEYVTRGPRGVVQPAVKCRGREYLRIIYGPEYDAAEHLSRLRSRSVHGKRSLALREFALGVESLERFVRREPLRRVHECVFAVLALESEPVDPRL
jgi:protein phosphatase